MDGERQVAPAGRAGQSERAARLREEMRKNLLKRKRQQRQRADGDEPPRPEDAAED